MKICKFTSFEHPTYDIPHNRWSAHVNVFGMKHKSEMSFSSILPYLTRLQTHLRRIDALCEQTKGDFTGAQIPDLPGETISGPSGPWHSSFSMWKIHFSWLKALASSPDTTINSTAAGEGQSAGERSSPRQPGSGGFTPWWLLLVSSKNFPHVWRKQQINQLMDLCV